MLACTYALSFSFHHRTILFQPNTPNLNLFFCSCKKFVKTTGVPVNNPQFDEINEKVLQTHDPRKGTIETIFLLLQSPLMVLIQIFTHI